jgi:hypothetical protein
MGQADNILDILKEKCTEATRQSQCGLILQPGAVGDCILTLPLAKFMKDQLRLGAVHVLGHTQYLSILPGRTCIDGVRSMDSVPLHRLFAETKTFDLADGDPLLSAFADYAWIVSFLGEVESDFEQNLIFAVNCTHSAEVVILPMKAPPECSNHIGDFHIEQLIGQSDFSLEPVHTRGNEVLLKTTRADVHRGRELLEEIDVDWSEPVVVIQPGSGSDSKCWHLDNFLAIAKKLRGEGINVVFLLGPAELERFDSATKQRINSAGKSLSDLSLTEVVGLLSCTSRFIGNDSGITHLAAGMGTRTVVLFGPTNPKTYRPIGPAVTILATTEYKFAESPSEQSQQQVLQAVLA